MTKSLRGITFGSPEYVRIAKRGEKVGQADGIISKLSTHTDGLIDINAGLNETQRRQLRNVRDTLNDLIGDYEIYYEE